MADNKTKEPEKSKAPSREERIAQIISERNAICGGMLSPQTLAEVAARQVDHEDKLAAEEAGAASPAKTKEK